MSETETENALRKPQFADFMIFVVATAVAIAVDRTVILGPAQRLTAKTGFGTDIVISADYGLQKLLPFLIVWTLALSAIQFVRPAARGRRIGERPGGVLCAAASLAILMLISWWGFVLTMNSIRPGPGALWLHAPRLGFAMAGAWSTLLLSGRWNPEPHWIDRTGRALGALWLSPLLFGFAKECYL